MRFTLFIISLFMTSPLAVAEDVFDLAEKYNSKKNQVVGLEANRRKILADIFSIEKETRHLVIKKTELNEKKANLNHRLKLVSKKIVQLEANLKELTPKLIERIAFVEQVNDLPWFYALLTSNTVTELDHLYKSAKNLNDQQYNQVLEFINLHKELKSKREELNATALKLVHLKNDLIDQEKKIEANQRVKSSRLKKLERKITRNKKNLEDIKSQGRKALEASNFENLGLLFGTDFFDKKGHLSHPVKGRLTQKYGLNELLSSDKVQLLHKGYFYQTVKSEEVKAIASGRVKYSGRVKGFGKVLILDHGGHYYSVYGNLNQLKVNYNQVVNTDDILGMTGEENLQFSKGLYFEIRHFSEPQDPAQWLVPQKNQLATLQRGSNENIN